MAVLTREPGCSPGPGECFGRAGPYWTFLGTPVDLLWMHALAGAAVAALALAALLLLRRAGRLRMGARGIAAVVLLAGVAAFLLAAALLPYRPQYGAP